MMPDSEWSHGDLTRAVMRVEATLKEMRAEQHTLYVPRETWDQAWRGSEEWKKLAGEMLSNMQAEQARLRRDTEEKFESERRERALANRWSIGLGLTGVLGVLGLLTNLLG